MLPQGRRAYALGNRLRFSSQQPTKGVRVKGYCVKCKGKKEIKDAKEVKFGKGRTAMKGTCPVCGTGMFCILPGVKKAKKK